MKENHVLDVELATFVSKNVKKVDISYIVDLQMSSICMQTRFLDFFVSYRISF